VKHLLLIFLCILALSGCEKSSNQVHVRQITSFGTTVEVTLSAVSASDADQALDTIEQELNYMHEQWHAWRPSSITRLNKQLQSGQPFSVDEQLLPLLNQSKELYSKSLTYFNPAIGKLIELWGFYQDNPQITASLPPETMINQLVLSNPNMDHIVISDYQVRGTNSDIQLDFGGYAKGYGVQQLIEQLRAQGISNAMVNAGGDIKVIGKRQERNWRVAIDDPYQEQPLGWLYMESGESIFSSGDYRRFFEVDGKRYHHIIDPNTGYPTEQARAATVIADDPAVADAAATALMVAPQSDWLRIMQNMGLKHILIVTNDGTLHCDQGFAERLTLFSAKKPHIIDE
jgi:thiamine biosynthesis lipoprotein